MGKMSSQSKLTRLTGKPSTVRVTYPAATEQSEGDANASFGGRVAGGCGERLEQGDQLGG